MFRNPTTDLIVVLVIVLVIFGPKRLPGLGKSLGQGFREFKDGITGKAKDEDDDDENRPALSETTAIAPAPPERERETTTTAPAPPEREHETTTTAPAPPERERESAEIGSEQRS
jgi:sec-independent protein translocase protein TatA